MKKHDIKKVLLKLALIPLVLIVLSECDGERYSVVNNNMFLINLLIKINAIIIIFFIAYKLDFFRSDEADNKKEIKSINNITEKHRKE